MSTETEKITEASFEDQKLIKQGEIDKIEADESDLQNVESRLIEYLQGLFELENLRHNSYLINRLNRNLELYPTVIYSERNVLNICQDPSFIDAALEKVKGIEYQSGSVIKLKISAPRKTVIVKNISRIDEQQFKTFIEGLLAEQSVECQFSYDSKMESFSITFAEETSAVQVFSLLLTKKFNLKNIDCILKEDNLYLELVEGLQKSKRPHQNYTPYVKAQYPYSTGYGFSSQPMPMYFMQYPSQILGQNYIRKSKESYKISNDELTGRPSNSTYESSEQSPTDSPNKNFSRSFGQYKNNGQYYSQRNGSGYRGNKTYYQKKSYDNEPKFEQDSNQQNEDSEIGFKNQQFRGSRDRQDQRYGYKRGDYKDKSHKYSRNHKKGLTDAEIEKLTKVDVDNYPPLA